MQNARQLNVAAFTPASRAYSPLRAAVLHLQGCLRACPGCGNPEMQPMVQRRLVPAEAVAAELREARDRWAVDTLVVTGGEPFLQAGPLSALLEDLHPEFNIVAYSGFTLAELQSSEIAGVPNCLEHADLLIEGAFVAELSAATWRGSSNQRLIFLSDRLRGRLPGDNGMVPVEIQLKGNKLSVLGFPSAEFVRMLEAEFAEAGITVTREGGQPSEAD